MREFSAAFTGGCLGGLINRMVLWFFGIQGINARFGIALHPALTARWLYPSIVWGGIWALLLLLPFLRGRTLLRGLAVSLVPSAVALFYLLPFEQNAGFLGLHLGNFTPLLIIGLNVLWGLIATYWYQGAR